MGRGMQVGSGLPATAMGTSTLSWFGDRGFELTGEVANEEVALRMDVVPIPADGTEELRQGVELYSLDVLFKASVMIEGEPGQVREAKVTLLEDKGRTILRVDARCEDVETGEIVPFQGDLAVEVPEDAPESGGPRPEPIDEDELDWDDETTLENLVVAPEAAKPAQEPSEEKGSRGLKALLEALASLEEDGGGDGAVAEEEPSEPAAPLPAQPEKSEGDQSMGAADEARGLLELLLRAENLELEEGAGLEALIEGTMAVLTLELGPEAKASKLSSWLLDQDCVADLFIGDEDLATILEQW